MLMGVERLFEYGILSPGTSNLVKDTLLLGLTVVALRRWHMLGGLRDDLHCGGSIRLRCIALKRFESVCKKIVVYQ